MKLAFRAGSVHVQVPATSANLGPGYDCLGVALSLHDDLVARVVDDGVSIDIAGEGAHLNRDEKHLVLRAMRAGFDAMGGQPRGVQLSCANRIPHGRGLGSSAAAIVAGVVLARALVAGGEQLLPDPAAFALAADLEGHPDNVAACFYGGLTIAWTDGANARATRAGVDPAIRPVLLVPPFESSTAGARGLLPATVPHADAVFGVGRSALLVAVLTGAAPAEHLLAATEDRLHQTYRASATPETAALVAELRAAGHAAVVSGAGPTVLVLARGDVEVEQISAAVPDAWRCLALAVDGRGACVVPVTGL
ncbi:MAG TPA: homoserine kinase [Jatrophihabitans sp.]|jgi:homoserine kinase